MDLGARQDDPVGTRGSAKERLVAAGFALFDERGYERTTVDDIAERAGVSRTTFFRVFRTKEDVIFPDHDELLGAIRERLHASTPRTALIAVAEAASLVLAHYLEEGERARARYRLTRTVPTLRERESAGIRQYTNVFRDYLHRWMDGGPDTALRAQLMANAVVTAHNHVLRRWLRHETDQPMAEVDQAMTEVRRIFEPRDDDEPVVLVVRTRGDLERVLPLITDHLT